MTDIPSRRSSRRVTKIPTRLEATVRMSTRKTSPRSVIWLGCATEFNPEMMTMNPASVKVTSEAENDQKNRSFPRPNGCRSSGGRMEAMIPQVSSPAPIRSATT